MADAFLLGAGKLTSTLIEAYEESLDDSSSSQSCSAGLVERDDGASARQQQRRKKPKEVVLIIAVVVLTMRIVDVSRAFLEVLLLVSQNRRS